MRARAYAEDSAGGGVLAARVPPGRARRALRRWCSKVAAYPRVLIHREGAYPIRPRENTAMFQMHPQTLAVAAGHGQRGTPVLVAAAGVRHDGGDQVEEESVPRVRHHHLRRAGVPSRELRRVGDPPARCGLRARNDGLADDIVRRGHVGIVVGHRPTGPPQRLEEVEQGTQREASAGQVLDRPLPPRGPAGRHGPRRLDGRPRGCAELGRVLWLEIARDRQQEANLHEEEQRLHHGVEEGRGLSSPLLEEHPYKHKVEGRGAQALPERDPAQAPKDPLRPAPLPRGVGAERLLIQLHGPQHQGEAVEGDDPDGRGDDRREEAVALHRDRWPELPVQRWRGVSDSREGVVRQGQQQVQDEERTPEATDAERTQGRAEACLCQPHSLLH
mmetsp:Transcript_98048/g.260512  ORF Transcript_98048/g.260512 Transcript_98048/m.260512 type:complete len:388 (+) Transcript_98048:638-1801(+)